MNDQSPNAVVAGIGSLVDRIAETIGKVDHDDLSGLAKLHGWCETLVELGSDDEAAGGIADRATSIVKELEALILGEVDDSQQAFDALVLSFNEMIATAAAAVRTGSQAADAEDDATDLPDNPAETDPAEMLARVFEDDPNDADTGDATAAEPAAEPDPDAAAATESAADENTSADAAGESEDTGAEASYVSEPLFINEAEAEFVRGFVEEAAEHLEAIEAAVLEVEGTPEDTGRIDDLFRPFHTIKGMAGFLNLKDINCLTHEAETLLDQGRKGKRAMTPGTIDLVFDVVDILKLQITEIGKWVTSPTQEAVDQPPVAEMINRLRDIVAGRAEPEERDAGPGGAGQRLGEIVVEQKAADAEAVADALSAQGSQPGKKIGEILVEKKVASARQVGQAIRAQKQAGRASASAPSVGDQSIRIETSKLDALVDMVGELVIAQTLVSTNERIGSNARLTKDVAQVTKIVRDVQEVAMAMRMVPIGPTFQKMARLVRDVSRKAGKTVELTISGEDTELDKTVIQQIGDPLVHMVRNAVDHGVESPQEREAAGKPPTGKVHLGAWHQGGNIVIEIRDDGKGMDPKMLIDKAVEKGILQPGEELDDAQAFQLIFAPGFSTAKAITDISGRGVGMDVVKRNIDSLRGKVDITSKPGEGSTFYIRLPLTLAIIDGMVVRIGPERFILPTITIEQSLRPQPQQITTVQQKGQVINVRGQLIPLVQLGPLFRFTDPVDPCEAMVIIAQCDGGRVGLVVDELIGQQQVVIKSLGERFRGLRGISGAAILGDGRVGLILETSGLAAAHRDHGDERKNMTDNPAVSDEGTGSIRDQVDSNEQTAGE